MNRHSFPDRKILIGSLLAVMLVVSLPRALSAQPIEEGGPAAAPTTVTYPIVDTNQTKCYNAAIEIACPSTGAVFYGQDAQFTGHAPSYTNHGNGTVTDNVTGLMWQRSPDLDGNGTISATDKLAYAAALTYCDNLTLSGYTDWRLPDIKTLYSLIEFSGMDPSGFAGTDTSGLTPFIDNTVFAFAYGDTSAGERIIDAQYASSTQYVINPGDTAKLFGVNFADGRIKGYDLVMPNGSTKAFFVQCVRGNTGYGVNEFVDNSDQTITDNATGLMWAQSDSGTALNWQDALAWVQTQNAANYLGHNDWRLPNAKEMQGIVDYTRSPSTTNSAAIDPIFNATALINEGGQTDWPWYWTLTTHATYNGMGASGVYLAFGQASGWQKVPPSATCYTLVDVHGAGAQRSDPKTTDGRSIIGTACTGGTAYGLGPQGDVQRGLNYIRLVRDVTDVTPPTAAFNFSPASLAISQSVQFTDTSIGAPTAWVWDFSDGITSTLQHPSHLFTATGSFTVTLIAGNAGGSDRVNHTVNVMGYALYLPLIANASSTTPTVTAWRFAVVGDTHVPSATLISEMTSSLINDEVELVLFPGDIVQSGAGVTASTMFNQLTAWQNAVAPLYNAGIGVYPIRGNHEADVPNGLSAWNSAFSGVYTLPANAPLNETNLSYSFVYQNALFVGLDEYINGEHTLNQTWLDQQLAANTQPHVFVFGHEAAFRTHPRPVLDNDPGARDAFWASLAAAGARTYFSGHDHFFDSARIADGDGNSHNDLYQIVAGTGGGVLFNATAYDGANSFYTPVGLDHAKANGYLLVELSGDSASDLGVTLMFKERTYDPVSAAYLYTTTYTLNYTAAPHTSG